MKRSSMRDRMWLRLLVAAPLWAGVALVAPSALAAPAAAAPPAAPTARDCATASEDAIALRKQEKLAARQGPPARLHQRRVPGGDPRRVRPAFDRGERRDAERRLRREGRRGQRRLRGARVDGRRAAGRPRRQLGDSRRPRRAHVPLRRRRCVAIGRQDASSSATARRTAFSRSPSAALRRSPQPFRRPSCPSPHRRRRLPRREADAHRARAAWAGRRSERSWPEGSASSVSSSAPRLGSASFSKWHDAQKACTPGDCGPGSVAQNDKSSATTAATISTVSFVAAGVLLAGAGVLWFTAPSGAHVQVAPAASPQGASLIVKGTF